MRRRLVMAWLTALAVVPPAQAQEAKTLPPVVVTATKTETPAAELGASVTLVTEEDFKTFHYPTVDEALRRVPGVEIRRSGGFGKTSAITIRGANTKQVQILVDGIRVKSPTLGEVDLSDISPDTIERIEVIRGPQSTLYGADAIGGVINIITKKGRGPFSGSFSQEAGSRDTYTTRSGVAGQYEIFDYALGGSHMESNGQFKNDDSEQNALNLRLGVTLPYQSSIGFTLRYNRAETGLPVKFVSTNFGRLPIDPIIDSNNRNISETYVMTLAGKTRPVTWWETELRLGKYDNTNTFVDLPDRSDECPVPPCEFPSRIKVERKEAEWLNRFFVGSWSTSTFGVELRGEEGRLRAGAPGSPITPFDADTHTTSGFFEEQLRFWERLFLSAGVRVEDNSTFGRNTTERGSLAYVVKEWGTRLRGGAGSGFRAPTFNELFFPGFSNPTLKPEVSFSWDVGADQSLWTNRARLGLTYFKNDFENLIGLVSIATPPFVRVVNSGRARAQGIEFTSEVDVLDDLVASLSYTYTNSLVLATRHPIPREPEHRWNIGLTWEPVKGLSLFTQVHVATQQWEATGGLGAGFYNSGHTRVDIGGTYRLFNRYAFIESVDLTARIQNLLNERYAEVRGFPALGLTALAGLRAAF
jgi:vitamin B12 transporter